MRGESVTPIELTSKLLFEQWKLGEGESDITVFEVTMTGESDGVTKQFSYTMLDTYDQATDTTSMARTTGYTATVVARMLAEGLFTRKGMIVPEYIGKEKACVDFVLRGLAERGITYDEKIEELVD